MRQTSDMPAPPNPSEIYARLDCAGDAYFATALRSIRSAQRSVDLEMYIFADAAIGRAFAEALADRARAGVPVRVIYGSRALSPCSLWILSSAQQQRVRTIGGESEGAGGRGDGQRTVVGGEGGDQNLINCPLLCDAESLLQASLMYNH